MVATLLLMALVASACSTGTDANPNVISKKDVPFGLLRHTPPQPASAFPARYITIYLDVSSRLVAVSHQVSTAPSVRSALAALGQGPTDEEAAQGLESPISTATPLTLLRMGTGTATVSVGTSFTNLGGADEAIAAAQLVYTLTAFPGVTQVQLRIDGKAAQVPTANGKLSSGPLARQDYASLAPL